MWPMRSVRAKAPYASLVDHQQKKRKDSAPRGSRLKTGEYTETQVSVRTAKGYVVKMADRLIPLRGNRAGCNCLTLT